MTLILPTDGEPETSIAPGPDGTLSAVITPRVLEPERAKTADGLASLTVAALMLTGAGAFFAAGDAHWMLLAGALLAPGLCNRAIERGWREAMLRETTLVLTPGRFILIRANGVREEYDRQQEHHFRIFNGHDAAKRETEEHELIETRARMRGRVIRKRKYHRDTFHLIFGYGRGRMPIFVMEIMGQAMAQCVLARVQEVDKLTDSNVAAGKQPARGPESEWDDMAGKLPGGRNGS